MASPKAIEKRRSEEIQHITNELSSTTEKLDKLTEKLDKMYGTVLMLVDSPGHTTKQHRKAQKQGTESE